MNQTANVVRGVLRPDGTLELAERPSLPAGDVEVTIRPIATTTPGEELLQYMIRTRAELEASGVAFRTKEEIDAELEDLRDWDGRLDEIRRQGEESQHHVETR